MLIESLLQRIKSMGILVKTLFMDREFFSLSTISTLQKLNTQYIIAATANKKINECLLYNILNLLKSGLKTTVYELKSAINGVEY